MKTDPGKREANVDGHWPTPCTGSPQMRLLLASSLVLLGSGCASQIRTELVGTGNGLVTTRTTTSVPLAGAGGLPLRRGTYNFDLRFGVPRAQVVAWKISCPGAELAGEVGETFDAFRERRLKVIEADREQQRKAYEAAIEQPPPEPTTTTTTVVTPPATVGARVMTPLGRVVVRGSAPPTTTTIIRTSTPVRVLPAPPPDGPIELRAGDDGHGTFPASVDLTTTADGVCTITALADDPNVSAFYSVIHVRDLRVEEAERKQAVYTGAVAVRTKLTTSLVTYGADQGARQRRREAEGRLRADVEARRGAELARRREIELRVSVDARRRSDSDAALEAERTRLRMIAEAEQTRIRLEAEARIHWEAGASERMRIALIVRLRDRAVFYRGSYITWLIGECHADPGRRGRIQMELDAVRLERERVIALRIEMERQERLRIRIEHDRQIAREIARLAELERQRFDEALRVRTSLIGGLVAYGARIRPPRPAPFPEAPGALPFDGAVWSSGRWAWVSLRGEWVWSAGGWSDPGRFGTTGGEVVIGTVAPPPMIETVVDSPVITTGVIVTTPVTIHVGGGTVVRPPPVIIRDNRGGYRAPVPQEPRRPVVRDNRTAPAPIVRDRRNGDDKDPKKVRDHR